MTKLLPENIARTLPLWPMVSDAKPAIALMSVFVGMKGTAKELGLTAQNIFAFKSNDYEKVNLIFNKYLKCVAFLLIIYDNLNNFD